ncbi:nuclear transport factor 2 family protein [Mucilaginibacter sp. BT774]|uniref:nuclear transport factor 2 family protein n=1 Tax=Mucilaginibacter sp. BT774 TaxID=3062276 RepID=UPI002674A5D3|nr:nuclear transport factor 2 family protein [Mucilaginibacter sp. BT774]MDO3628324.1 nuclear transport factor 2 family protein [Mucilaginibacter sp. BT774]
MYRLNLFSQKVLFILALVFVGIKPNAFSQDLVPSDSLAKVLINKEAEMFHIVLTGDKVAAEKMIGQDYITINADGVMENKIEMMKTFGKFKGATTTLSNKKIRVYGNLAIITGGASFYIKSIMAAKIFYTETWVYRDHQWYFIGWQGTMTGLPTYYPIIFTVLGIILLYFVIRLIVKKIRKPKFAMA